MTLQYMERVYIMNGDHMKIMNFDKKIKDILSEKDKKTPITAGITEIRKAYAGVVRDDAELLKRLSK